MDINQLNYDERKAFYLKNMRQTQFVRIPYSPNDLAKKFIDEMNYRYANGGMKLFKLETLAPNKYFRGELSIKEFIEEILNNASFKNGIKEIFPKRDPVDLDRVIELPTSLFVLIGTLSSCILQGGAYTMQKKKSNQRILELTTAFVNDFLGEDYLNFSLFKILDPWTHWFHAIAWDATYIALNRENNNVNLICFTDTD